MRWWPFGTRTGDTPHGASYRASPDAEQRDERLSAYLDDDLTATERAALDAELGTDEALRADLDGMRAVTAALAELGPVRAPRPFTLEAPPVSSRRPRILDLGLQLGAALSALLLVVAIVDPGDGGGITATSLPIEQSRTAETPAQLGVADAAASADAATGGGVVQPEGTPAPGDGAAGATGSSEEGGGAASSGGAVTDPGEPATPPTESLQVAPSAPSGGSTDVPAPAGTPNDFGATSPNDDAGTNDAGPRDGGTGDTPGAVPPPANTGPGDAPTTSDAGEAGSIAATAGDADTSAKSPEPVPGTGEALATSDLGGEDENFVPALAVLTALLTALVALRWAQTRRLA